MYLIGPRIGIKALSLSFITFFSSASWSDMSGQLLPSQIKGREHKELMDGEATSPFFLNGVKKKAPDFKDSEEEHSNAFLPGTVSKKSPLEASSFGATQTLPSSKSPSEYISADDKRLSKRQLNKGKTFFSLSYLRDRYSYESDGGLFESVFRSETDSQNYGTLHGAYMSYIYRSGIDLAFGVQGGAGYNKGKGRFVTGQISQDASFTLWTFPADLLMAFEIPMGGFMKTSISAGPSALLLYQTRSDFDQGQKKKRRRQIGLGAAADLKLKFSMNYFFPKKFNRLGHGEDVSQVYLHIGGRYQTYSYFPDEGLKISGVSFFAGATFDYL